MTEHLAERHGDVMRRKIVFTLFILFLTLAGFSVAGYAEDNGSAESATEELKDISFSDLAGMTAGVKDGAIHDTILEGLVENPKFLYFNSLADECIALEEKKVDYVLVVQEQYSFIADEYDDLVMIPQLTTPCGELGFIFAKNKKGDKIRKELNQYIVKIRESGELKKLQDYWFTSGEKETVEMPSDGKNGVLTLASGNTSPPFIYLQENKTTGFEPAILAGFCKEYGYGVNVVTTDLSGILPAVTAGKCDIAANSLIKTPEREEAVNFSETTCEPVFTILMRSDTAASFAGIKHNSSSGDKNFIKKIGRSFYKTFIVESRWKLILQGCGVTLMLTLLSGIIGILLGLQIYKAMVSKHSVCRKLISIFNAIMGGTPMVVLLMIFYYVIFNKINLSAFVVAVIAFALNVGSSVSEIYRTAINSIDPGQMEAALALGYSYKQAFYRFIMPQAIQRALPLLKGQMVSLLKGTAIVGFISLQDLTKMGDLIRSRTYEAFFPLITVAVIYFIIGRLIRVVANKIQSEIDPVNKRKKRLEKNKKEAGQ